MSSPFRKILMRRYVKDFFIPHEGNGYRPHSLREESALILGATAVFLFAGALLHTYVVSKTAFYAAVIPSVLVDYANESRANAGMPQLRWNPALAQAADAKARDMAERGYFSHTSPDGTSPWQWLRNARYEYRYAGENLAVYFTDSLDVHAAWMNSPGHRANILQGNFTEIGVATARGVFGGRETIFVVEFFGTPLDGSPRSLASAGFPDAVASPPATPYAKDNEAVIASEETGNELFVAVRGQKETLEDPSGALPQLREEAPLSSSLERLVSSPLSNIRLSYAALFAIIVSALFLGVFIEIRRAHPRHVFYGMFLLTLLSVLYYSAETYVFPRVFII